MVDNNIQVTFTGKCLKISIVEEVNEFGFYTQMFSCAFIFSQLELPLNNSLLHFMQVILQKSSVMYWIFSLYLKVQLILMQYQTIKTRFMQDTSFCTVFAEYCSSATTTIF